MKNPQMKVGKVMREFKAGELKSSSGQKVTNPKQAIAIGLSEAGISKKARGGEMKESKAMMRKEVSFMKKKGAPKSMIKHEMAEAGMKRGGNVKKMATGGASVKTPSGATAAIPKSVPKPVSPRPTGTNLVPPPIAPRTPGKGLSPAPLAPMGPKKMASGGLAAGHKSADGIVKKGRTKGKEIKMAKGGMSKSKKYC